MKCKKKQYKFYGEWFCQLLEAISKVQTKSILHKDAKFLRRKNIFAALQQTRTFEMTCRKVHFPNMF
jgi:hypothetical protein